MKRGVRLLMALVYAATLGALLAAASAQGAPPPMIYSGQVFVAGQPAPDGLEVYAKLQGRRTGLAITRGGRYEGLSVGAVDASANNQVITFWASWDSKGGLPEVTAEETDRFVLSAFPLNRPLDLNFPTLPSRFPPTPTAGPGTPQPTPTPTSIAPIPGDPAVPTAASVALVAGVVLLVAGAGTLRLLRRGA